MIEWTEQQMIRDVVRRFVEAEIEPKLEELEHGDTPPYDILRKMMQTFGIDEMARQRFQRQIAQREGARRAARRRPRSARRAPTAATAPACS